MSGTGPDGRTVKQAHPGRVKVALLAAAAVLALSPLPARAQGDAAAGKTVYAQQCAMCHGPEGAGDGPDGKDFYWRPADLKAAAFKFRSTRSGQLPTDADLTRTIRRGLPGTAMVAMDHLSEKDIADVIAHIKTLSPKWTEGPGTLLKIEPPKDLEKLATAGADMYQKAGCAQCHGEAGLGDGASAGTLTAGGRPTRPADLTRRPFKGGDTATDIYRALAGGMDGTPMPSFIDALDPEQIWAMAVHVTKLEQGKADMTEDEKKGRALAMKQPGRKGPPASPAPDK